MTTLRIDTAKFKEACEEARYRYDGLTEEDHARNKRMGKTIRDHYRFYLDVAEISVASTDSLYIPSRITTADELRSELRVAAQAAQEFGATQAQIDFIVSLAVKANDFNVFSGGRLSKVEASRIIDNMKR